MASAVDADGREAPDLLRPDEAARRLGVARRTILAMARRGEIGCVARFGSDGRPYLVRFTARDLQEWQERNHRPARRPTASQGATT